MKKKKIKRKNNLIEIIDLILQIGFLGVVVSLGVALTFWVQYWWIDMPVIFKILWVIGWINIFFLFTTKNWGIFK